MTGQEIVQMRERLGLSRKGLAERLRVPYETVCRWENANRSPSKFYEAQLRMLARGESQALEPRWLLLRPNLERIRRHVSRCPGYVLGTVHALVDANDTLFLAIIRLRPDMTTLGQLKDDLLRAAKRSSGRRRGRVIGFFTALDRNVSPTNELLLLMKDGQRKYNAGHCVIYGRSERDFFIWRPYSVRHTDVKKDHASMVSYLVLG